MNSPQVPSATSLDMPTGDDIGEFIEFHTNRSAQQLGGEQPPGAELPPPPALAFNPINQDVIEATVQCLLAQAEECIKNGVDLKTAERTILEEFGRCWEEVLEFSLKTNKL